MSSSLGHESLLAVASLLVEAKFGPLSTADEMCMVGHQQTSPGYLLVPTPALPVITWLQHTKKMYNLMPSYMKPYKFIQIS